MAAEFSSEPDDERSHIYVAIDFFKTAGAPKDFVSLMGDFTRSLIEDTLGSKQLVEDLAEILSDKVVVKMTTIEPLLQEQPQAMRGMRSPVRTPNCVQIPPSLPIRRPGGPISSSLDSEVRMQLTGRVR